MTKNEWFKVLRERHTTGEMRFPLLVSTLSCSPRRPCARALARAGFSPSVGPPRRATKVWKREAEMHFTGRVPFAQHLKPFIVNHFLHDRVSQGAFSESASPPASWRFRDASFTFCTYKSKCVLAYTSINLWLFTTNQLSFLYCFCAPLICNTVGRNCYKISMSS